MPRERLRPDRDDSGARDRLALTAPFGGCTQHTNLAPVPIRILQRALERIHALKLFREARLRLREWRLEYAYRRRRRRLRRTCRSAGHPICREPTACLGAGGCGIPGS